MTSGEAGSLDKRDKVALLPAGSLEQHGDHLPLGTDAMIAEALAADVERRDPARVVLLPCLWLGHSPHHLAFPGTASVGHRLFADMLTELVESLIRTGFRRIAILNGHGGNALPIQMALQELKNRHPNRPDLAVFAFQYWSLAASAMRDIRTSAPGGMGHACEMETSVVMHLRPELVRTERIRRDGKQPMPGRFTLDMLAGAPVTAVYDFHDISETGTFGDPTLADAERGRRFFEAGAEEAAAFVAELCELPLPPAEASSTARPGTPPPAASPAKLERSALDAPSAPTEE